MYTDISVFWNLDIFWRTDLNVSHKSSIQETPIPEQGRTRGAAPSAPLYVCPPWEAEGGTNGGGSFNITSACISLPQVRHSGVPRGAVVLFPPWDQFQKYKIKRKLRLESNNWQWQRLRICLNSLLIQGETSFSLLKRILHYTRCTKTESRLNDLALYTL